MITIYTRLGDPECMKAKTFLETYGIKYENVTILESNPMVVPRFEIEDQIIELFFPSKLINLLNIQTNE